MDVALVGIDGLDPSLVREWQEDLPTLDTLIRNGSSGRLRSADPPLTSPAWPTLYTGKQGGKHGVFGFTKRREENYERIPVNYNDVQAESLWEILDAAGVRCGVANVPLSYPPSKLEHGFVLSGWPVPNNANVSSPASVVEHIEAKIGEEYQVNPFPLTLEFDQLANEELFEHISEGLWHHHQAYSALLEEYELDIFFCVYMAIDIASHNFAWEKEWLHDMYVQQDQALAELVELLPDNTEIVLLSDHGHGAQGSRSFHINEWLKQNGYLTQTDEGKDHSFLQLLGITQSNYVRLKNKLKLGNIHDILPNLLYRQLKRIIPKSSEQKQDGFDPARIDWNETVAYSGEQNEIFLNTESDHPKGIVTATEESTIRCELKSALLKIPHPDEKEGGALMSHVATKEELFEGTFTDQAPDLVFVADGMRCNAPMSFSNGEIITSAQWGEHRQYGTLITSGPSFANKERIPDADIKDILPLVLSLVETPIPENVDGTIPQERLEESIEPKTRESRDSIVEAAEYSQTASENVRDQLEGLGYLE